MGGEGRFFHVKGLVIRSLRKPDFETRPDPCAGGAPRRCHSAERDLSGRYSTDSGRVPTWGFTFVRGASARNLGFQSESFV